MPTFMLYNGPIYTLDPTQPRVQAIAVRDGRVIAAGSEGKVQAAVGGRAEGINLRGRAVVPALTDAHVHLVMHGLTRREIRLEGIDDLDVALKSIAAGAQHLPEGAWVRGGGWDHSLWGGRWPTAAMLDALIPDRPVALMRKDGHSAWVNSRAMQLAGIDDSTPDPPGGAIQREKKRATGILLETAIDLVRNHMPAATDEERLAAVRDATAEAHGYGMVGVHVPPGLRPGDATQILSDLQRLRERGQLQLRCLVHLGLDELDSALRLGLRSGLGDHWLRIGGVKMFSDGSLGSETAEMLSHYEGRRHLGSQTMTTEELNDAVRRAIAGGISVTIHAIGDAANRRVLDAIELAQLEVAEQRQALNDTEEVVPHPRPNIPNRIEHCQILHPKDIPRFAELGVVASMQPIHATADMDTADRLWGERCAHAYAWRSLKDSGAILAFGSDAPVESLNPWLSIHAAVTRQRPGNIPPEGWYPEQRLTVEEALWGFTVGAAIAAGTAREQGTLMPGMLADLAVLSADPFKINPSDLHAIRSELTMLDGEIVSERRSIT
ncbi:MAG TPA: amidohydrolase [Roseiflexaceae bacterium]|nr:amidohydrolase [Roseiflexaceae bacterium]